MTSPPHLWLGTVTEGDGDDGGDGSGGNGGGSGDGDDMCGVAWKVLNSTCTINGMCM